MIPDSNECLMEIAEQLIKLNKNIEKLTSKFGDILWSQEDGT